ncbi:MAG: hypothetical protein M9916_05595 [Crocinitomicaceae bacterium]|jgi:hypothetical protein|nr:hypothetical protein [Crocinitomicaceae bacterium]
MKIKYFFRPFSIIVTCFIFLFACTTKSNSNSVIVGKWEINSITPNESDIEGMELIATLFLNVNSIGTEYEFNEDGSFVVNGEKNSKGEYKTSEDSKSVKLKTSSEEMDFNIVKKSNNEIVLESVGKDNNYSITLKRK